MHSRRSVRAKLVTRRSRKAATEAHSNKVGSEKHIINKNKCISFAPTFITC